MSSVELAADLEAVDLAHECLYRFLAATLRDPYADDWPVLLDMQNQRLACEATDLLRAEAGTQSVQLGFGELPAQRLDLRPLLGELRKPLAELRAEYDRVFGLVVARECPPYETEYHPTSETFFRSQQLADIAGFYRAFGLEASRTQPERVDHLALELEFMAFMLLKKRLALAGGNGNANAAEQACICDQAQGLFLKDHLAWWVPSFATGLRRKAGEGFYATLGGLLAAFLPTERGRFRVDAPRFPLEPALIERPEEQSACTPCSAGG
jgi:TorA maturation chaperone TorD